MIYYRHYIVKFLCLPGIEYINTNERVLFDMFYEEIILRKSIKVDKCTANENMRKAVQAMARDGILKRISILIKGRIDEIYHSEYVYVLNETYETKKTTHYFVNPDGGVTNDGGLPEPASRARSKADDRSIAEKYWWLKDY